MVSNSNRINTTFAQAKQAGRKILSSYITAGDPTPSNTVPLLHTLVDSGVDILELGIPFTDPMAEGPIIQAAMQRALRHHVNISDVLQMVREFRDRDVQTPVVLMGYLNPIETMGYAQFAAAAQRAGVDGLIIVDLPVEEAAALNQALCACDIYWIALFSPTTAPSRLQAISAMASGYLYYVALKGVTGAGHLASEQVAAALQQHSINIDLPILIGFGIKTAQSAAQLARLADGVVVGSALVEQIARYQECPDKIDHALREVIQSIRRAIDGVR